jgi:hypothetical protein
MADADDIDRKERVLDYAHVEDLATPGLRYVFVRLVPTSDDGSTWPANTLYSDEAHVDLDAEGNVIGVTVMLR